MENITNSHSTSAKNPAADFTTAQRTPYSNGAHRVEFVAVVAILLLWLVLIRFYLYPRVKLGFLEDRVRLVEVPLLKFQPNNKIQRSIIRLNIEL